MVGTCHGSLYYFLRNWSPLWPAPFCFRDPKWTLDDMAVWEIGRFAVLRARQILIDGIRHVCVCCFAKKNYWSGVRVCGIVLSENRGCSSLVDSYEWVNWNFRKLGNVFELSGLIIIVLIRLGGLSGSCIDLWNEKLNVDGVIYGIF